MKKFTPVTRYVCEHCKQDFRTSNRHNCKRDPEKKNCYTCKHNNGWESVDNDDDYGEFGSSTSSMLYVICAKEKDDISALDLSQRNYVLNCNEWEKKETENE